MNIAVPTPAAGPSQPIRRLAFPAPRPANPRSDREPHALARHIRLFERAVSHFFNNRVFPHLPFLRWPYDLQFGRALTLAEVNIRLPKLDPSFNGISILLVSDPHAGPLISPGVLENGLAALAALRPDLIIVAGDFVSGRRQEIDAFAPAFARLRAPLGVFGVLGNHDHYTGDAPHLRQSLERFGIRVLHNTSELLGQGEARLNLAGVDDPGAGEPDLARALAEQSPRHPTLLVTHNPDIFFAAARSGVDLVLAGHTHGGQIRLPSLPPLVTHSRHRFEYGLYTYQSAQLVLSRGLGVIGIPLRLFCPPEAVWIRLTAA